MRLPTWLRRLLTRGLALLPAMVMQWLYGDEGTYQLLLLLQVVLALQLPFTLVPLVQATSSKAIMGTFVNPTWMKVWYMRNAVVCTHSSVQQVAAWMCTGLIVVTNTMMVMETVVPHGPGITHILDPISIILNVQAMLTANMHKACAMTTPFALSTTLPTGITGRHVRCLDSGFADATLVDAGQSNWFTSNHVTKQNKR